MWQNRSKILTPLSSVTSKQATWHWSKEFDTIKKLVCRESPLSYPNFNEPLEVHKDASKL